jgi:hypothetical protein
MAPIAWQLRTALLSPRPRGLPQKRNATTELYIYLAFIYFIYQNQRRSDEVHLSGPQHMYTTLVYDRHYFAQYLR